MPAQHYDLIVVGAGVLGSFHAYHACRKGLRVLLLERDLQPMEATVRNFGQIVPSGMPVGEWQHFGRRSLEIYGELQHHADMGLRRQGSVYLASDEEEANLLNELHMINERENYPSRKLTAGECLARYEGLRADYCRAGLFFPNEITIEPARMINNLLAYMQEQLKLVYSPMSPVISCEPANGRCLVEDSGGNRHYGDKVIICNGRDFKTLFPERFLRSDIEVSKLQMMRTVPQQNFSLKGSILTGLSIRRYESFRECPSFNKLAPSSPDDPCRKWGIHLLFRQSSDGSLIIGDSHEYADAPLADALGYELNQEINDLILQEARRIFHLPSWSVARSWAGFYAQSKTGKLLEEEVLPNIHILTAIGGKGMTAGPAVAEKNINKLFSSVGPH